MSRLKAILLLSTLALSGGHCPAEDNPEFSLEVAASKTGDTKTLARILHEHPEAASTTDAAAASLLHLAAYAGQLQIAEILRPYFPNLNTVDNKGLTPLHYSVQGKRKEMIRWLIAHGAKLEVSGGDAGMPLHWAVSEGNPEIAALLLDLGADPNARGPHGTPLMLAGSHTTLELARVLLKKGAAVDATDIHGCTAFYLAAQGSNRKFLELLLNAHATPNFRDVNGRPPLLDATFIVFRPPPIDGYGPGDWKARPRQDRLEEQRFLRKVGCLIEPEHGPFEFFDAAAEGDVSRMRALLALFPDGAKLADGFGNTALHHATFFGHDDATQLLLDFGADPNALNGENVTPLHLAVYTHRHAIARRLLAHQANPNLKPEHAFNYEMPINAAAKADDPDMVKLLLEHGARVEAAVFNALCLDFEKVLEELLRHRAAWDSATQDRALVNAATYGSLGCIKLLLKHGFDPNAPATLEEAPLLAAIRYDKLDAVFELLEHGANPDSQDWSGDTPLHLAVHLEDERGALKVVKLLLAHHANPFLTNKADQGPISYMNNINPKVVLCLLPEYQSSGYVDPSGRHLLVESAGCGYKSCVKYLLSHDADPNVTDKYDDTPLQVATDPEIRELLLNAGAKE